MFFLSSSKNFSHEFSCSLFDIYMDLLSKGRNWLTKEKLIINNKNMKKKKVTFSFLNVFSHIDWRNYSNFVQSTFFTRKYRVEQC